MSSVYYLALHPTMDFSSQGRDSVCRIWDIRTRTLVYTLREHQNTISSVLTHPELVTASFDSTIKLWHVRYWETLETLTHHKKSVRIMAQHDSSFSSASTDVIIKKFKTSRRTSFIRICIRDTWLESMQWPYTMKVLWHRDGNARLCFEIWQQFAIFSKLEERV